MGNGITFIIYVSKVDGARQAWYLWEDIYFPRKGNTVDLTYVNVSKLSDTMPFGKLVGRPE